ncbi:MAG: PAS domain S-box protein [Gallionellaceae bacterium]|jgi:PAS domain S-box-containing protein
MEQPTQLALEWFSTEGFMPHGHCYLWTPGLLWTFVIAEAVIVLAYFSIPFGLLYFVRKRTDLSFNWMFKLFSAFIFACGINHLLDIWTIWHADYWFDAMARIITATLSVTTAVLLLRLIPQALKQPSTQQLEAANSQLQAEIEQRNMIEAELSRLKQNSDERYRILFEQAALGVAEIDPVSIAFRQFNQRLCDILGYERSELQGINFQSLTHPDDWPAELRNLQALKAGEFPEFTMETRCLRKDGATIWVKLTVSPTRVSGAAQDAHITFVQDITARKLAEQALQEKLDELERWHEATLGRETRVLELKREVNELLLNSDQPPRYANTAGDGN